MPLFKDVSDEDIKSMVPDSQFIVVKKNDFVFAQGDAIPEHFFIIWHGAVEMTSADPENDTEYSIGA
jgi:hypothetical protein